ncbi:MAG: phage tail sheath subtilisin-like domain-containing protein [Variovorax sp.]|nr:phage tail sheath subtilisin-like domain-containing protein [Xanthomonadaceae bacterium]MDZ4358704.1 phage tail sheath subtilisin-like domain-containing protein [Variovorax sp.]
MSTNFLHGVEVVEIDNGARPISVARSSVIGLVGTAPDLDAVALPGSFATQADWDAAKAQFPLNTPVLIAGSLREAAQLGLTGTLPAALRGIFDQTGALVVVVRVAEGIDAAATQVNVIGGVDVGTGQYTGISALLGAESVVKVTPRVLIAHGFSHNLAVANALLTVADRLRAVVVADGPNTDDAAAIAYAGTFGSPRLYIVDPWVKVLSASGAEVVEPASARVAGVIAKSDSERGFWWSPSNRELRGVLGTARPVDFALGDANARANLLNEAKVATVIHQNGFRLWGNRSTSVDPKFAFLSVRRTADIINESLLRAHLWAVDRNLTRTYVADVTDGLNAFLRQLTAQGAILGGRAWADPDLNTAASLAAGQVFFNFEFTPPAPAERVTFRSQLTNDFLQEILS